MKFALAMVFRGAQMSIPGRERVKNRNRRVLVLAYRGAVSSIAFAPQRSPSPRSSARMYTIFGGLIRAATPCQELPNTPRANTSIRFTIVLYLAPAARNHGVEVESVSRLVSIY